MVNIGFIQSGGKSLLIDSGEEAIHNHTSEFLPVETVFYTHYHRDQCSGVKRMKDARVKISVPASEAKFFRGATGFWEDSDKLIDHRYDFRPEMMVLRESVEPGAEIQPGETINWFNIPVQAVATPMGVCRMSRR